VILAGGCDKGPDGGRHYAVSKSINAFGGFELDRFDPAHGEHEITTAADPNSISDDILAWISRR
jgi:hypothetical protein